MSSAQRTVKGAAAPFSSARADRPRFGVALAGGGPLGAIYEIGALCALDEAIPGLDLADADAYVGVSAGAFIAAGLANGMRPRELCKSFIENEGEAHDVIDPSLLVQPAWGEFAARLARLPGLAAQTAWRFLVERRSLLSAAECLGRALPTGVLSNRRVEASLRRVFSAAGRTNDFRELKRKLVLVATDLDSGASAPFGQPGWDQVPISVAVQASSAMPGLYPPVEINGRCYVDGALKKTLHASVLLDEGLDLLICLNPLVPFDATRAPRHQVLASGEAQIPRLVDGGLPLVLSQTLRTLIHSRLELGMKGYERSHPGTDIVLFEPDADDPEMFLANTFSYSQRRWLAEHAYQRTRELLRVRRDALAAQFARHGLAFDDAVLDDRGCRLLERAALRREPTRRTQAAVAAKRLDEVLGELERRLAPG